jgi:MarR family transcriptional regulator, 2-MHQ and catechol-resistance regulon repressor
MMQATEADTQIALKLWVVLSRTVNAVGRHTEADVARHGIGITEFGVLEVLYHKGPMLLGEVREKILISGGGVTYVVDKLEKKGLVERRACTEDRRATYAALTADGEALMGRIFPEHARCLTYALSGLSPEEKEMAVGLLKRLGGTAASLPLSAPETSDG